MPRTTSPVKLAELRGGGWRQVPTVSGVYWWYFPTAMLQHFKIVDFCSLDQLNLRVSPNGDVCLYHGLAKSLLERVKWHAAQKLTMKNLQSGYLSTFRLSLLALNHFDYTAGSDRIDAFFDELSISWQTSETRQDAEELERAELAGDHHYPLNIAGNSRGELQGFIRHLKSERSGYKRRYLSTRLEHGA